MTCPAIGSVGNGVLNSTLTSRWAVVMITCDPGYRLNGALTALVQCRPNGTWSTWPEDCQGEYPTTP